MYLARSYHHGNYISGVWMTTYSSHFLLYCFTSANLQEVGYFKNMLLYFLFESQEKIFKNNLSCDKMLTLVVNKVIQI